jgi:hypothetical protein
VEGARDFGADAGSGAINFLSLELFELFEFEIDGDLSLVEVSGDKLWFC